MVDRAVKNGKSCRRPLPRMPSKIPAMPRALSERLLAKKQTFPHAVPSFKGRIYRLLCARRPIGNLASCRRGIPHSMTREFASCNPARKTYRFALPGSGAGVPPDDQSLTPRASDSGEEGGGTTESPPTLHFLPAARPCP